MCVMVMTHKTENRLFPVSYVFSELADTSRTGKTWESGQKQAEKQGTCIRNRVDKEMRMPEGNTAFQTALPPKEDGRRKN